MIPSFLRPSPTFLRKFAACRMIFWFLLMPVVAIFQVNLQSMTLAILEVSLYANLASDATYWQAARVETELDSDETNVLDDLRALIRAADDATADKICSSLKAIKTCYQVQSR